MSLRSPSLRDALDRLASRIAPGMGGRALVLTSFATLLLLVYQYQGSPNEAPRWFLEGARALTGITVESLLRHAWGHSSALVLLFAIPLAYCWSVEGWGPRALGLGIRGAGPEVLAVLAMWAAMVPLVAVFAGSATFQAMYPRVAEARDDATIYALHESFYLVKWIAWEFFFRGFLLFGLQRDFLGRASLVSTVAFAIVHIGKPEPEALGAVIAGLVLCWLALRGRSIWPGVLLHWLVAGTMDFFASTWWR